MNSAREDTVRATRVLSSRLFGGAHYRLEVAAAIAEGDGLVNLTALMQELPLSADRKVSVNNEIARLRNVGLLVPIEDPATVRRRWLRRVDSPCWQAFLDLRDRSQEYLGRAASSE